MTLKERASKKQINVRRPTRGEALEGEDLEREDFEGAN